MRNYEKLRGKSKLYYLLTLENSGKFMLYLTIYQSYEFKTFSIRIDSSTLEKVDSPEFDFSKMNYINITKDIQKKLNENKGP